jgi:hypothetical protein
LLSVALYLSYYSLENYEKSFDKNNKGTLDKWHELEKARISAEQNRFNRVQENNSADPKAVVNIHPQPPIPSATNMPDDMLGVVNAYKHIFYLSVASSFILLSTIFIFIVYDTWRKNYPKKFLDEEFDDATKPQKSVF